MSAFRDNVIDWAVLAEHGPLSFRLEKYPLGTDWETVPGLGRFVAQMPKDSDRQRLTIRLPSPLYVDGFCVFQYQGYARSSHELFEFESPAAFNRAGELDQLQTGKLRLARVRVVAMALDTELGSSEERTVIINTGDFYFHLAAISSLRGYPEIRKMMDEAAKSVEER